MSKLNIFVISSETESREIRVLQNIDRCYCKIFQSCDFQDSSLTLPAICSAQRSLVTGVRSCDVLIVLLDDGCLADAAYAIGMANEHHRCVLVYDKGFVPMTKQYSAMWAYGGAVQFFADINDLTPRVKQIINQLSS